jgi:hypothetical protein
MREAKVDKYITKGQKRVSGWLSIIDAEIIASLLDRQNQSSIYGAVAEIGVHHGKLFVLLCLGRKIGEKSYCIDVFGDQHLNEDKSGCGDREAFENTLRSHHLLDDRVVIDGRSSEIVAPRDLLDSVGPVRLFSVDGGHWTDIVKSDLSLAEEVLADRGVIALDDFHRAEWPNVSEAYFKWFDTRKKPIVPFAIGFNKLYLCHTSDVGFYQEPLYSNERLRPLLATMVEFQEVAIPVYQRFMEQGQGEVGRLKIYLRTFHPLSVARIKRVLHR